MVDVCKSQTGQAAITPGISGLIALGFQFLTRFAAVFAEEAGDVVIKCDIQRCIAKLVPNVDIGTDCAGVNVMGSRGCTGVLLADSWAGCAPHPTISMVTIAVMITSFTAGQRLSRRWRSSRFFFARGLQRRKRFFHRDFAGLSGSHSARRRDVPRRSGRRPRPRPWS